MSRLINFDANPGTGAFLNKWFYNRTVVNNKNIILPFTGATGSGKSYSALSVGESWYKFEFNEKFPITHVCFDLGILMERILTLHKEKKLRKGDLFILEEAGANFGNLEFQNKISKMFSYILQSFRSMNLILILTVPVLTMINKTARQLVHAHFITAGINYDDKRSKVRPYFHQLAQKSGKSYWKYPRVRIKGKMVKIERLTFTIPSSELIEEYEKEKTRFVVDIGEDFLQEYRRIENAKLIKGARDQLTDVQMEVFTLLQQGLNSTEIAKKRGTAQSSVSATLKIIRNKGYRVKMPKKMEVLNIVV